MKVGVSIMGAEGIDRSMSLAEHVRSKSAMRIGWIVWALGKCMFLNCDIQELDDFCVASRLAHGIIAKYNGKKGYEHVFWTLEKLYGQIESLHGW